ncbi:DEAD/DEAH box helicase [Polyangium sorediatum]|uniref:DEAD/DEAH box helicase n=1 Tax=Polyangium sorediatum TaxID=889274 RepID=A0ABT6PA13_9BACT|nr:DEAD/DEAH box helicase [Polyangium sorediatum]MDI1437459.1 DEAD/DEAH box helicase [Polyangium sorediatum]
MFHPLVDAWFTRRFGAATPVQVRAWPTIQRGEDCLIAAPTGSGKTLAAFLACLDRLVRASDEGRLVDRIEVVYVSPLKALSNDVQKNLDEPIAELTALADALGLARPAVRTAVRTGDTPEKDRRRLFKKPPHVLVTTPESLFILLGSASGRRALGGVRTVIVDEIHAVASDKRGAHLALSIERLEELVTSGGEARPQRVGLSATMRPIEIAARMLVGAGRPLPEIVDAGVRRDLDLAVEVPRDELGAVCTNEQWDELYDRVAEMCRAHKSTLVFVNTRRLVERVALHLGERLGEETVAAHHGSLSRSRRLAAERRLKAGELKVVVATASLELGIDVGAVELVCLVGSPRSIATALQRIGRSGHALAATPKGRMFPLTRDQLLECAAIVRSARRGEIDRITMRDAPLDVLAQQIVAACASGEWGEDELFALMRRAAPYETLTRAAFDDVVQMLAEGVSARRGRAGALLFRDGVGQRLKARRGASIAALTSGGAIPDNGNYDVVLADGMKVGSVDEDFAIDSSAGDVFLLGSTSWRIRRIEAGKVWVEDAPGAPPTVPFWFGEGPARTRELSAEVGLLREEVARRLFEGREADEPARLWWTAAWLEETCALDRAGAVLLCEYVAAARSALGEMPSQRVVVAERFFDEAGGMQLILHAPFGARINRAWGLALRKRFCRSFDFELQAAATDDGVLLSLGAQHSFPLNVIFEMLRPEGVVGVLEQAALQAPMFGTRFRWNATRALQILRFSGGRKVPAPLVRMRSDDLIAAVFPAQLGCQDNHGREAILEIPDHPLVRETMRDCLTEVMDAEGLAEVLERIQRGEIRIASRETAEPSVLSHEILNANPYAFLDDAPLEERRARAVTVRRGLPAEIADRIGGLDPEAIEAIVAEARPVVRDADELHDLLLDVTALPEEDASALGYDRLLDVLVRARRAAKLAGPGIMGALWVAAERRDRAASIWPAGTFSPVLVQPARGAGETPAEGAREAAIAGLVRGWLAIVGPIQAAVLAERLSIEVADIEIALARVEADGVVLRGRFSPDLEPGAIEWCDRRLLARIHRRTVDGLRRAIEPASPVELMRFLLAWQGVIPGQHAHGAAGLARVVEQLQGFEIAAGAWESEILPARVEAYDPSWLDLLCLSGEVTWGRLSPRASAGGAPTRAAPITLALRRDLAWLLAEPSEATLEAPLGDDGLSLPARRVLATLGAAGASFFEDIVRATGLARPEVEEALWELVSAGRITGDGFAGLRGLLGPSARARARSSTKHTRGAPVLAAGRWALFRAPVLGDAPSASVDPAATIEAQARQLLRRWGIVFRELVTRESRAPAWRDLVRVYRRLEMRGEVRGGRLVASFVGEQFALPEALESLRALRKAPLRGEVVRLSACDPLNLVGTILPGERVPSTLSHFVTYRDGMPIEEEDAPDAPLRDGEGRGVRSFDEKRAVQRASAPPARP